MGILALIILGGLAGWIASALTKTDRGVLGDVLLGILGAVVGGIIMNFVGNVGITGFNLASLAVAVIGSVVLIGIGRLVYR